METISVTNSELDDTANELIEGCLATPPILRQLLRQFSNSELLALSLVNKQWNFEARSVLKDRGNLIARLSTRCTCESVVAFASDMEKMRVVPFSGIHVVISHPDGFQSPSSGSLDSSYNVILDRLPCKHFSVSFIRTYWKNWKDCHALKLVTRIMEIYSGVIETFSLTLESNGYEEMLQQVFQQHWDFPHLKTFKIKADRLDDGGLTTFAKTLVSRAPSLQELHFDGAIIFEENILKGSAAVLVPAYEFCPLFEIVCDSMMSSVRAEKIVILAPHEDFQMNFLSRAVPMALEASRTTLTTVRMDLLFVVPLMCYGICLENVTKLEISMRSDHLQRIQLPVLALVKAFDFTRIFPQLENVKVEDYHELAFKPHHISSFIERGNAALREPLPDRAINIKHLKLTQSCWDSTLPFWACMFPNIVTLEMNVERISTFPFTTLWERFTKLEELFITSLNLGANMIVNLDSVFCGIFPEEVAELVGMDDEYLKAVNIVPVMPSIACLRDLRTFTLDHTLLYSPGAALEPKPDQNYLFTKVTALVGFASCPTLAVKFLNNSHTGNALGHMEPYVSIVIIESAVPYYEVLF